MQAKSKRDQIRWKSRSQRENRQQGEPSLTDDFKDRNMDSDMGEEETQIQKTS